MIDGFIIEAVVQVGMQETRYLRCGRGEQVVVVLAAGEEERLRLMREYAAGHRVIAPVPFDRTGWRIHDQAGGLKPVGATSVEAGAAPVRRPDTSAVSSWLCGVIDGLGLQRPTVVLAGDIGWMAQWLADGCGDTFDLIEAAARQDC